MPKIATEDKPKIVPMNKDQVIALDPEDPRLEVDYSINGRFEPYTRKDVEDLIPSILKHGLIQAGEAISKSGGKWKLMVGFRRYAAVLAIKQERLSSLPIRYKFSVIKGNEDEAFRRNLDENVRRRPLTNVDVAHNINRMLKMSVPKEEILATFPIDGKPMSESTMTQILKVLQFTLPEQRRFHQEKMALNQIMFLADNIPEPEQRAAVLDSGHQIAVEEILAEAAADTEMPIEQVMEIIAAGEQESRANGKDVEKAVKEISKRKGVAPEKGSKLSKAARKKKDSKANLRHLKQAAEEKKLISGMRVRKLPELKQILSDLSSPGTTGIPRPGKLIVKAILEMADGQLSVEELKEVIVRYATPHARVA